MEEIKNIYSILGFKNNMLNEKKTKMFEKHDKLNGMRKRMKVLLCGIILNWENKNRNKKCFWKKCNEIEILGSYIWSGIYYFEGIKLFQ